MRSGRLESWRQISKVNCRRDSFELWEVVASKVDVKLARRIAAGTLLNYEKWSPQNAQFSIYKLLTFFFSKHGNFSIKKLEHFFFKTRQLSIKKVGNFSLQNRTIFLLKNSTFFSAIYWIKNSDIFLLKNGNFFIKKLRHFSLKNTAMFQLKTW